MRPYARPAAMAVLVLFFSQLAQAGPVRYDENEIDTRHVYRREKPNAYFVTVKPKAKAPETTEPAPPKPTPPAEDPERSDFITVSDTKLPEDPKPTPSPEDKSSSLEPIYVTVTEVIMTTITDTGASLTPTKSADKPEKEAKPEGNNQVPTLITTAPDPSATIDDATLQRNVAAAKALNELYATLEDTAACTENQVACIGGNMAVCNADGSFTFTGCGKDARCFAMPMFNVEGVSVGCTAISKAKETLGLEDKDIPEADPIPSDNVTSAEPSKTEPPEDPPEKTDAPETRSDVFVTKEPTESPDGPTKTKEPEEDPTETPEPSKLPPGTFKPGDSTTSAPPATTTSPSDDDDDDDDKPESTTSTLVVTLPSDSSMFVTKTKSKDDDKPTTTSSADDDEETKPADNTSTFVTKTRSADPEETEETTSKEESKTTSKEESKTTSKEASKTSSAEPTTTEKDDEPTTTPGPTSTEPADSEETDAPKTTLVINPLPDKRRRFY